VLDDLAVDPKQAQHLWSAAAAVEASR